MSCNPSKYKKLTIKKRGNRDLYSPIGMIPSCKEVEILGVTFQCNSKFSVHAKNKLTKANKSLHIRRTLLKKGYSQLEIGRLFNTIVLPNINHASSVYAASECDLTPVQCFLDRYDFLERQDRKIFKTVSNAKEHPLLSIMSRVKLSSYNPRKETCFIPKINTAPLKNSVINR